MSALDVFAVGFKDCVAIFLQGGGDCQQGVVFLGGGGFAYEPRCLSGVATDLAHVLFYVHGFHLSSIVAHLAFSEVCGIDWPDLMGAKASQFC